MKPNNSGLSASNGSRTESPESRYIRLLSQFPADGAPLFTNENDSKEDVAGFAELLRGGFIDGCAIEDEVGRVFQIANMTITISGRTLLAELERKRSLQTSVGIIKEGRWGFYKWFLSSVGGGVIGYMIRYYTE
jgi:hypothetical protein